MLQQLEACLDSRATREELYDVAQEWGREAADLLRLRKVAADKAGSAGSAGLRSEACPDADWRDASEVS